ncbi:MAG: DUF1080 domain-containing protein [Isosphaeraceae bacterium]
MKARAGGALVALGFWLLLATTAVAGPPSADPGWVELIGPNGLDGWRKPTAAWFEAADARPDQKDPSRLAATPGRGIIVNGLDGKTRNLLSKEDYGDVEVRLEFLIPKGSNSGIKLEGLYEVQIADRRESGKLTGSDCGGVYPRAELFPRYHHLDDGHAPAENAARPAGEWQSLSLRFLAPRFDARGRKVANARLRDVVLNGRTIHADLELKAPTGHAWRLPEVPRGPILLQGDHGPVAFRKLRVRPIDEPAQRTSARTGSQSGGRTVE